MTERNADTADIVQFLRVRDYKLVRELGQGACGKTVLLHDDIINEHFVCKKYTPYSEEHRQSLFRKFLQEIRLLHKVHHPNLVRVFNYYVYPDQLAGFILMGFVRGQDIRQYIQEHPETINEIFLQVVDGFRYLEARQILHRDIRPQNILVRDDGIVKIIDLGFGKRIGDSGDFNKSISLNLWCEPPLEFQRDLYDFRTEVYFIGSLFEQLVRENSIEDFKYTDLLREMCQRAPSKRVSGFSNVNKTVQSDRFYELEFATNEMRYYRRFADALESAITKIERGARYKDDIAAIEKDLERVYRDVMLEETVPDASLVLRCLVEGTYYYRPKGLSVSAVRDFLHLLRGASEAKKNIIMANLHTRLDVIERYAKTFYDDEIPF